MKRNLIFKEKIFFGIFLWVSVLLVGFSAFSQTPYNIVMNIYDDPKTEMAFNWFTTSNSTGEQVQVAIGVTTNFTSPFKTLLAISEENVHKAVVTGLSPGTTYSFRLGKNGAWSDIGTFTTAPNNKAPFSFIYVTDSQIDYQENPTFPKLEDHVLLQNNANEALTQYPNANFWLHCGDLMQENQYNMSQTPDRWKNFFSLQQNMFLKKPFAPIIGNHDLESGVDNFKRHFNIASAQFDSHGSTYTFIYGDAQFFGINSEWLGSNLTNYIANLSVWMRNEISAHPNIKWRIVYFHQSAYRGNEQHSSEGTLWRHAIVPLFDELNIDIAFFGHDHLYQVIGPVFNNYTIPGSVTDVQQDTQVHPYNTTSKKGGIFNVSEGTLYFNNSSFGNFLNRALSDDQMPDSACTDLPHYFSLFTGMLGQGGNTVNDHNYNSFYSNVMVYTDSIVITTHKVPHGIKTSLFLDEIKIIKQPINFPDIVINTNTVWNSDTLFWGNIIVQPNATLTLNSNCTLKMNTGKKIIVEPDAKLVVNGGTITNARANKLWEGIVVKGTTANPQDEQTQGSVILTNATIENAVIAVNAASENP